MNKILYRPHIDGLRGVAIIAVVLYHAKLLFVRGGFVGVDVFFVISGFLITSIIVRDLQAGTFSLTGFWERRVRRIIPALSVVMFAAIIAAYFLSVYPPDYRLFGNAVVAQSVFASNFLFMLTDNYFDHSSVFSPLLHTWSLSVEEQFYVLFPFVVILCGALAGGIQRLYRGGSASMGMRSGDARTRRAVLIAAVSIFGIASLLLSIWLADVAPDAVLKIPFFPNALIWKTTYRTAAFYMLPTRAWELAIGILITLAAYKIRSVVIAEATACVGLFAIILSAFLYSDVTAFPGVAALLPTFGAGIIIIANESHATMTGKILSHPGLVWFGLISYSLYLWHWPLFVFSNLASAITLSSLDMAVLTAVAVLISWLSYRYIETPFRNKALFAGRYKVFLAGALALGLLAFSGILIQRSSGTANRISPAANKILLATHENIPWGSECFQDPRDGTQYGDVCRIGAADPAKKPKFIVWGDSHADALVPLFELLGLSYGVQGVVFDDANCAPLPHANLALPAAGCSEENERALRYIEQKNIRTVILVARWSNYVRGGLRQDRAALITDSNNPSISSKDAAAVLERNLVPLVRQLSEEGREVYIVEQAPEQFGFDLRDAFYRAVHSGQDLGSLAVTAKDSQAYQALADSIIESLRSLPDVHIIDPSSVLCEKEGLCELEKKGILMYRDGDHLSTAGAMSLEPLFTNVFLVMR